MIRTSSQQNEQPFNDGVPPGLDGIFDAHNQAKSPVDIAMINLVCASGLPRSELLKVDSYITWIDEAARRVKLETGKNYHKFLVSPGKFGNSQARFCMVCLVTVLQQQLGVRYNPKWKEITPDRAIPESFGVDPGDLFIHAIIDGIGGTCGSLPVLYIAVGRRLGYPLKLVKASRHLFVRWDDPEGKMWHHQPDRFNVEATGPGVHFLSDQHYRDWPHPVSDQDVQDGIFLKSLECHEELAEFLATRAHCFRLNGFLPQALDALQTAARLAPQNKYFMESFASLRAYLAMRKRGHAFLNSSTLNFSQERIGPIWIEGQGGRHIMVQVISPVALPFQVPPGIGRPLVRQHIRTPQGTHSEVWLPIHDPSSPMTARWVMLHDGRWALVHEPVPKSPFSSMDLQSSKDKLFPGHPIVPDSEYRAFGFGRSLANKHSNMIPHENASYLTSRIMLAIQFGADATIPKVPLLQPLSLPVGPAIPQIFNSVATHINF